MSSPTEKGSEGIPSFHLRGPPGTSPVHSNSTATYEAEINTEVEEARGTYFTETSGNNADNSDGKRCIPGTNTLLIPQPTDDETDPLTWSTARKWKAFCALLLPSLLTDWGMLWGAVLYEQQAPEWHMTVPAVSASSSGGIFLQGIGGILAVPLIQRFGRLPVLFWSQFLTCCMIVGAANAPGYGSFTAFRTLQGLLGTAPQVVSLTIIHDMFFFHERARMINIWAFLLLLGPFLGPFIALLCSLKIGWRADFGVLAGFYAASSLFVLLFGEETLFDRGTQVAIDEARMQSRLAKLCFIGGMRVPARPSFWTVLKHLIAVGTRPQLLLPAAIYTMVIFMWAIGISSTVSQFVVSGPYFFTDLQFAWLWFAPMIGAILGFFWGNWFNDWLCNRYIRIHKGEYQPENRLWGMYPSVVFGVAALVLYGQALQHQLSWAALAVAWAMMVFALLSSTAAVSAYVVDIFPHHTALSSSVLNFWRTSGGFCVTYFQFKWVLHNGAAVSFGCQAAILGAAFFSIVLTQIYGKTWRFKFPPPAPEN